MIKTHLILSLPGLIFSFSLPAISGETRTSSPASSGQASDKFSGVFRPPCDSTVPLATPPTFSHCPTRRCHFRRTTTVIFLRRHRTRLPSVILHRPHLLLSWLRTPRDEQTITPEALESVKATLASSEVEHKAEVKKRAIPLKAADDYHLFCGFVSFSYPTNLAGALKEMNGKYVGNRPIKLRKSNSKERTDVEALARQKIKEKEAKREIYLQSKCRSGHLSPNFPLGVLVSMQQGQALLGLFCLHRADGAQTLTFADRFCSVLYPPSTFLLILERPSVLSQRHRNPWNSFIPSSPTRPPTRPPTGPDDHSPPPLRRSQRPSTAAAPDPPVVADSEPYFDVRCCSGPDFFPVQPGSSLSKRKRKRTRIQGKQVNKSSSHN
ncbi:hypothetical protein LXL04_037330 [Taraxacum kok-saghyz]